MNYLEDIIYIEHIERLREIENILNNIEDYRSSYIKINIKELEKERLELLKIL